MYDNPTTRPSGLRLGKHGRRDLPQCDAMQGTEGDHLGAGDFSASALRTIVVQWARCWRAFDARDRAEIFVDGAEVMFSHVLKIGPWHNLQKIPVEGLWHAARIKDPWWTGWMQMIHIHASSHDQNELGKRVAPFRQPSFVRRQVAGDDMRSTTAWRKIAEISSSTQIGCRPVGTDCSQGRGCGKRCSRLAR